MKIEMLGDTKITSLLETIEIERIDIIGEKGLVRGIEAINMNVVTVAVDPMNDPNHQEGEGGHQQDKIGREHRFRIQDLIIIEKKDEIDPVKVFQNHHLTTIETRTKNDRPSWQPCK